MVTNLSSSFGINIFHSDKFKCLLDGGWLIGFEKTLGSSCFLVKLETEKHSGNHYAGE